MYLNHIVRKILRYKIGRFYSNAWNIIIGYICITLLYCITAYPIEKSLICLNSEFYLCMERKIHCVHAVLNIIKMNFLKTVILHAQMFSW